MRAISFFDRLPKLFVIGLFTSIHVSAFTQTDNSSIRQTNNDRLLITDFFKLQASVKYIYQCVLNNSSTAIAWSADDVNGPSIHVKSLVNNNPLIKITAAGSSSQNCSETEPQWSPDETKIAFLSDAKTPGQVQIFIAESTSGKLISNSPLSNFDGNVSHLHWSPDGKFLSVLYVEKATRNPNPMAAQNRNIGLIDSVENTNVQRIAITDISANKTKIISPEKLYVFEYDWAPDSKSFAYTAAAAPGDDNWYIAKLYKQNIFNIDTVCIYQPKFQIALPRWSPDGKCIGFIEGLMSDQGGTGGEIYLIDASKKSLPKDLTPGRKSTPAWFTWLPDENILFNEFIGGSVATSLLNTKNLSVKTVWHGDASIRSGNDETSMCVANNKIITIAFIKSSWNTLPQVMYGDFNTQKQVTHINDTIQKPIIKFENIHWLSDNKQVQGWLLYPDNYDSLKKYPMLVCVHGGPAWITTPAWAAPDFNTTVYTQFGYFVFFPNARGSYGQGEEFTLANRGDWGFGDLHDIIKGIDTIIKKNPSVDNNRLGILGWSYGGSMAMISGTQTYRFKAAVAGAGACNWKSYYGQNNIDKWMKSYFNASPYDDPKAYEKVSAITYIKQIKTPTLVLVGERDGESPPPQSFEFWHALKELHVPTQLYVYADEGHEFENFDNMIDVSVRTIEWFNKYLLH